MRLDVSGLLAALRSGDLSSAQITSVYLRRGRAFGERLNAVTCEMAESAMEAANEADRRLAGGIDLRPLEGLPISIKECFICRGTAATVGLRSRVGEIDEEDGLFVRTLRDFGGAIPMYKTNVPPMMMSIAATTRVASSAWQFSADRKPPQS